MSDFAFVVRNTFGLPDENLQQGGQVSDENLQPWRRLRFRGEWKAATIYYTDDVVHHEGSSWYCYKQTSGTPPVEGDTWTLVALKGKDAPNDPALIPYENPDAPEVTNLKEAMDRMLNKPPEVTPSTPEATDETGNPVPGTPSEEGVVYEAGQALNAVTLTWSSDKTLTSQAIDGIGPIDPAARTYTVQAPTDPDTGLPVPFTSDQEYTITLTAENGEVTTVKVKVTFQKRRFWGTSALAALADADILAMSQELAADRKQSRVFDCTGGKYFYLIYPAAFGEAELKVNEMPFSALTKTTRDITNAHGHTESYLVYRAMYKQRGTAIPVEVL